MLQILQTGEAWHFTERPFATARCQLLLCFRLFCVSVSVDIHWRLIWQLELTNIDKVSYKQLRPTWWKGA